MRLMKLHALILFSDRRTDVIQSDLAMFSNTVEQLNKIHQNIFENIILHMF